MYQLKILLSSSNGKHPSSDFSETFKELCLSYLQKAGQGTTLLLTPHDFEWIPLLDGFTYIVMSSDPEINKLVSKRSRESSNRDLFITGIVENFEELFNIDSSVFGNTLLVVGLDFYMELSTYADEIIVLQNLPMLSVKDTFVNSSVYSEPVMDAVEGKYLAYHFKAKSPIYDKVYRFDTKKKMNRTDYMSSIFK